VLAATPRSSRRGADRRQDPRRTGIAQFMLGSVAIETVRCAMQCPRLPWPHRAPFHARCRNGFHHSIKALAHAAALTAPGAAIGSFMRGGAGRLVGPPARRRVSQTPSATPFRRQGAGGQDEEVASVTRSTSSSCRARRCR
jgi:hypothetical protein